MANPGGDDYSARAAQRRAELYGDEASSPISPGEIVNQLWWRWADFSLEVVSPAISHIDPPVLVEPEPLTPGSHEFVYPILDSGFRLEASKASEMFSAGMSMCKLNYTIEKMVAMLIERLKAEGISPETEVQIRFGGYENAMRKGFECIINLSWNVVVNNYDPEKWGERYLQMVKVLAEKGYGYPSETPRDTYRQSFGAVPSGSGAPSR